MKYYILLDDFKRINVIKKITEVQTEDLINFIEVEINNIDEIIIGETGFIDNKFVYIGYTEKEILFKNKNDKIQKLQELKNNLFNTDYKIIKCYEAFMRQQTLPYNLEELSAQRDLWRAEINQLEEELKELE
jgi:hypothetical protein